MGIQIIYAQPFHVGDNAYTVSACIGAGNHIYHVGPGDFPYFTSAQAEMVAAQVVSATFDPAQWTDGYGRPLRAA